MEVVTFCPLLTKLSFAGCQSSVFQICPVRNLPAAKTLALPPDFSCFVLFFGLCSKCYVVAERSGNACYGRKAGNTYYEDDVEGFIQEFFLEGGNVDMCKGGIHALVHPLGFCGF